MQPLKIIGAIFSGRVKTYFLSSPLGHHPKWSRRSRKVKPHSLKEKGRLLLYMPFIVGLEELFPSVSHLGDVLMVLFCVEGDFGYSGCHLGHLPYCWVLVWPRRDPGQLRIFQCIGEGRGPRHVKSHILHVPLEEWMCVIAHIMLPAYTPHTHVYPCKF